MNINKVSVKTRPILFGYLLLSQATVYAVEDGDSRSKFIEMGAGYRYSTNIYKTSANEKNSSTPTADIAVGYEQQQNNNEIALNYYAEYANESANRLKNNSYWTGSAHIKQRLFSDNLQFNLTHTRQRYIVNQSEPNLDSNQDERDFLNVGLQWFIRYSQRSSIILGASHSETWFNGGNTSDSNSNKGQVSWQYLLADQSKLELSYSASKNKFDDFDNSYNEHNADVRLTREYVLGVYSLNAGKTWVDGSQQNYNGAHYGFTINALLRGHLLSLITARELTNSSVQAGEDDELDFSQNQLFWRTRAALVDKYAMFDDKLISNIRLYFDHDNEVATINSGDTKDKNRYGAKGQLTWVMTEKLSSSLLADHNQSDLSEGGKRKFTQFEVSSKYNITDSLYVQFSASHEEQGKTPKYDGYNEEIFATRIAVRY
ncbi:hypothetical protein [Psychromonas sp. MME2]|uniref:hypothetical protein n=1 Tax=unclassified Psychromonas TaxID=2614957 RepID=UPI00339B9FC2